MWHELDNFSCGFTAGFEKRANEKIMPTDAQARQLLQSINNVYRDNNGLLEINSFLFFSFIYSFHHIN